MAEVRVNINGKDMTADDSRTILQVIRDNKIDEIPTLCYEERLGHITSCFLCVVEVEGAKGLVPSCSTLITDGMVIKTRTEKVKEARKTCLELLFSDHYADCISPCSQECPAGIDIQGYIGLTNKGLYKEAVELIKEKNPLPIVCGRVCVRKCELACRRNLLDEPVAIDFLKRHAAESDEGIAYTPKAKARRKENVVIIGAGPAGLSAAYYLALEGYQVEIFEAMPEPGGMLRYGIPSYRLPKERLDLEIDSIRQLGVKIHCNKKLGRDFTIDDLKADYDAVLLAMGSWGASGMRVENENAEGVVSGLDILRKTVTGELKELKGRVLVVGGGNTAIDVSRTAVRLGADETVVIYRRTEEQMPAHHEEIEAAKKEGVKFKFLVAPTRVITDENGKASGLECQKMELGEPDKTGRPRPVPVEGSEYVEPADYIVAAIGQYSDLKCLEAGEQKIELDRWKNIAVNSDNMETNIPGVFSAGDVVTGPATVIEGIAAGRKAALSIHNKLSGEKLKVDVKEFGTNKNLFNKVSQDEVSCFECSARHPMPERNPVERVMDFKEVELGYSREDALAEAARCFQCGCLEADECVFRKYGGEYGILPTRYLGDINKYEVDRKHPFVTIDPNKCIKCGRCIKTCERILDGSALGFINRGFATIIAPAMGMPLAETDCISCGNCIDTCPTGALSENQPLLARMKDEVRHSNTVCSFCSVGCRLSIKQFGRDMRFRSQKDKETGNGDYLCIKGHFGSSYLNSTDRLTVPMIKKDGKFIEAGWEEALNGISDKIIETRDRFGSDAVAIFVSPKLTNEEIYLAGRLAKDVIGTELTGSYSELSLPNARSHHEIDHLLGLTISTNPMDDVLKTDVILLVNADPFETHPSFSFKINEARRNGAKVIIINSDPEISIKKPDLYLNPEQGRSTLVLSALTREIVDRGKIDTEFINKRTEGFEEFEKFINSIDTDDIVETTGIKPEEISSVVDMITEKKPSVMVVYDLDSTASRSEGGDLEVITNLLLMTGNIAKQGAGLILLQKHANSAGLHDMTRFLTFSTDSHIFKEKLLSGKIKAALIIGENPLENPENIVYFKNMEFIAVIDMFRTETTNYADVILPASTHIETGGTFTGLDRKVQRFPTVTQALSGKNNIEILSEIAGRMDKTFDYKNAGQVFDEIRQVIPEYGSIDFDNHEYWTETCDKCKVNYLYCCNFATDNGKAKFSDYSLKQQQYLENKEEQLSYNSIDTYFDRNISILTIF
jgi:formate dehydrogenase major subunit